MAAVKSFSEFLEDNYGITWSEFDNNYEGSQANEIWDAYNEYLDEEKRSYDKISLQVAIGKFVNNGKTTVKPEYLTEVLVTLSHYTKGEPIKVVYIDDFKKFKLER